MSGQKTRGILKRGSSYYVHVKMKLPDGRTEEYRKKSPKNTKRGAEEFREEVRDAIRRGVIRNGVWKEPDAPTEILTLDQFAEKFFETYADAHNRARTVREKKRSYAYAIQPALGKKRINEITALDLESFRSKRLKQKTRRGGTVSKKTANEEVGQILKMLREAKRWGLVSVVPDVDRLRVPKAKFDFLSKEEAAHLVATAQRVDPDPWAAMIFTAVRCGLRLGELRGLHWDDVCLRTGRILVSQGADDENVFAPTKNYENREVPLGDEIWAVLKAHRHLRGPLVFCDEKGGVLAQRTCTLAIEKITRLAGMRRIGWHVLRHTFASHLVMEGASLKEVQELGGWQSLGMVLRYSHLSPEARRDAVRRLDSRATSAEHNRSTNSDPESKNDS
jgi:integrase